MKVGKINAVFEFWISGFNGGAWTLYALPENVDLSGGSGEMHPNCLIKMSNENFVKLANGKLNLKYPWNWNKIKIEGDKGLAMKLGELFKSG